MHTVRETFVQAVNHIYNGHVQTARSALYVQGVPIFSVDAIVERPQNTWSAPGLPEFSFDALALSREAKALIVSCFEHDEAAFREAFQGVSVSTPEPAAPDAPAPDEEDETPMQRAIREECAALCAMLLAKNKAYGNSAAEPVRVFAKGVSTRDQLLVRMDDKLSRLARGTEYAGDDSMLDLAGYIVLYRAIERIGGFE